MKSEFEHDLLIQVLINGCGIRLKMKSEAPWWNLEWNLYLPFSFAPIMLAYDFNLVKLRLPQFLCLAQKSHTLTF